jgi:hypothetical protein
VAGWIKFELYSVADGGVELLMLESEAASSDFDGVGLL